MRCSNYSEHPRGLKPAVRHILTDFTLVVWIGLAVAGLALLPGRTSAQLELMSPTDQFARAVEAFEEGQQLLTADQARAHELFLSAAKRFESVIGSGVINGRLEYNTGNAYLQAGDIGRAILYYLRARRLMPRDDQLTTNLSLAAKRRLTNIESNRTGALLRSVLFWHYDTSTAERIVAAIVLYISVWILLTLRNFVRTQGVTIAAITCGGLTLILTGSILVDRWMDRNAPAGVILSTDVVVYKGPGTGYQRQFEQPLQPGTEFTLHTKRSSWWEIELPNGQSGWVDSTTSELVPQLLSRKPNG